MNIDLESNLQIPQEVGEVSLEAFNIYRTMLNNASTLSKEICSICKQLKEEGKTSRLANPHFHGSEFGMCYRQVQLNIITPFKQQTTDITKQIFLYDGHLHEEVANNLLGLSYSISHRDEEIIYKQTTQLSVLINEGGFYVDVNIVCHPDLIVEYNQYADVSIKESIQHNRFLIEFKAVKDWYVKNKLEQRIVPNQYYGQCQIYMEAHNIDYTLLMFKNRATSEIYPPFIIKRNPTYINKRFQFLAGILYSLQKPEMVPKEYSSKKCDACKFCDYYKTCWE